MAGGPGALVELPKRLQGFVRRAGEERHECRHEHERDSEGRQGIATLGAHLGGDPSDELLWRTDRASQPLGIDADREVGGSQGFGLLGGQSDHLTRIARKLSDGVEVLGDRHHRGAHVEERSPLDERLLGDLRRRCLVRPDHGLDSGLDLPHSLDEAQPSSV